MEQRPPAARSGARLRTRSSVRGLVLALPLLVAVAACDRDRPQTPKDERKAQTSASDVATIPITSRASS